MKTTEELNETTTLHWTRGKVIVMDSANATAVELTPEDISKMAAIQDDVHGFQGDEVRRIVQFAARMMAGERYGVPRGVRP